MQWVKNKQKLNKEHWHLWFAWKPVNVFTYKDGNEKIVWFEKVLRRYVLSEGKAHFGMTPIWKPEYMERPKQPDVVKPVSLSPNNPSGLSKVSTSCPMPEVNAPAPPVKKDISWKAKYGNGKKGRK